MFQTKEKDKTLEELSKLDRNYLPNTEIKVMILKTFSELRRRMDDQGEALQRVRNIKRN